MPHSHVLPLPTLDVVMVGNVACYSEVDKNTSLFRRRMAAQITLKELPCYDALCTYAESLETEKDSIKHLLFQRHARRNQTKAGVLRIILEKDTISRNELNTLLDACENPELMIGSRFSHKMALLAQEMNEHATRHVMAEDRQLRQQKVATEQRNLKLLIGAATVATGLAALYGDEFLTYMEESISTLGQSIYQLMTSSPAAEVTSTAVALYQWPTCPR